jgi:tetratricopeptide (TPR) repeat protein
VLTANRDYDAALAAYATAKTLATGLVARDSQNVAAQVLLAGIHRPIGDAKFAARDWPAAVDEYRAALAIDERNTIRAPNEPEYKRLLALTTYRLARVAQAQGLLADARAGYQRTAALLQEIANQPRVDTATVRRDLALAKSRFGAVLDAAGDVQGRAEVDDAIRTLRELAAADTADARAQRDLATALVARGDLLRVAAPSDARTAYSEARQLAMALTVGRPEDSGAAHDLATIERRLADLARGPARIDLQIFSVADRRRTLLLPGDPRLHAGMQAAVAGAVPPGWSRSLIVFGSDGPARVLQESDLSSGAWTLTLDGPTPSQTLLLVGTPRPLTASEITRLSSELGDVAGPRTIDSQSELVWSTDDVAVEGDVSARGSGSLPWVRQIRDRIEALGRVMIAGRTFPLAR